MAPPSEAPLLLVYLDRYHLGDPLFLQRFAPVVKGHEGPLILLHGTGEAAERVLEAEGQVVVRKGGVLEVEGEAERALVERSAHDLNRRIVHTLNEAGVSAIRVSGVDRGLLRLAERDGLAVGRVRWMHPLVQRGVVPVIALVAESQGRAVEVNPGRAVAALASAYGEGEGAGVPVVVMFGGEGARRPAGEEEGLGTSVAEPETALDLADAGVRVRVAHPTALRGSGVPAGVDLMARRD